MRRNLKSKVRDILIRGKKKLEMFFKSIEIEFLEKKNNKFLED